MARISDNYYTPTTLRTFSNNNGNFVLKGTVQPVPLMSKGSTLDNITIRKLYKEEAVDDLKVWRLVRAKVSRIMELSGKPMATDITREAYNNIGEVVEVSNVDKSFKEWIPLVLDTIYVDYCGKELETKGMDLRRPANLLIKTTDCKFSPMAKRIMSIVAKNAK